MNASRSGWKMNTKIARMIAKIARPPAPALRLMIGLPRFDFGVERLHLGTPVVAAHE